MISLAAYSLSTKGLVPEALGGPRSLAIIPTLGDFPNHPAGLQKMAASKPIFWSNSRKDYLYFT